MHMDTLFDEYFYMYNRLMYTVSILRVCKRSHDLNDTIIINGNTLFVEKLMFTY